MNKKQIFWLVVVALVIVLVIFFSRGNKSEAPIKTDEIRDTKSLLQTASVKLPDSGGVLTFFPVYTEKEIGNEKGVTKNIIAVVNQDFGETKVAYLVSFEVSASGNELIQKSSLILGEVSDIQSLVAEDVLGADYAIRVDFIAPYNVIALNKSETSSRELYVTVDGGVFNSNTAEFIR